MTQSEQLKFQTTISLRAVNAGSSEPSPENCLPMASTITSERSISNTVRPQIIVRGYLRSLSILGKHLVPGNRFPELTNRMGAMAFLMLPSTIPAAVMDPNSILKVTFGAFPNRTSALASTSLDSAAGKRP